MTSLISRYSQEKGGREMHPNEGKQQILPPNPVEPEIFQSGDIPGHLHDWLLYTEYRYDHMDTT
jgi:hypothetical protein